MKNNRSTVWRFYENGLKTIFHNIQYSTGSLWSFFWSLTNWTHRALAIISWWEGKFKWNRPCGYFFFNTWASAQRWKWFDKKHQNSTKNGTVVKSSSNLVSMPASVKNKAMKNDFCWGFLKCSLSMKLREATQFTPFNFYPLHSQMLTVV